MPLTPRMFDLLRFLVEQAGKVVSHHELLDRVWANASVTNSVLVQNIAALRRALDQNKREDQFIETVPKRGYRFAAPVEIAEAPPAFEPRKTVAVLPFQDRSANPGDISAAEREILSVSIADALTLRLGRFTDITVRPVASMRGVLVETDDPLQAGRRLAAQYVVSGQFELIEGDLAVTVNLFRMADQQRIWRGRFVVTESNALTVEQRIAGTVREHVIGVAAAPSGDGRSQLTTPVGPAHREYLRGRYFWNRRGTEDLLSAIACFKRAIELDPDFGLAYSGLADSYTQLINYGAMRPSEAIPLARAATARAIELNPNSSEARASSGYILAGYDWEWLEAEKQFRAAMELNPNNITVRHWLATLYVVMHQHDLALEVIAGAREVDPLSPILGSTLGMNLYFMEEFEWAEHELTAVLELESGFAPAALNLGRAYQMLGRYSDAIDQLTVACRKFDSMLARAELAHALFAAGNQGEGKRVKEELLAHARNGYVPPYSLALVYEAEGDRRMVEKLLDEAFEEHSISMMWFAIEPRYAAVRGTPFGQRLLRRANHPPAAGHRRQAGSCKPGA